MSELSLSVIAHLRCDFKTKFGLPRQSGVNAELRAEIVFEPEYRSPDAVRGLEQFSHIWLIWGFMVARREGFCATVRPPQLGGNARVGVFATRSPNRPNPIGLTLARLDDIVNKAGLGCVLRVSGVDMMDNTPIYDIKPYLPYADSRPDALSGFAMPAKPLRVSAPDALIGKVPEEKRAALIMALSNDPRPAYQNDPNRIYGFLYAGFNVRFTVSGDALTVCEITKAL